MNFWSPHIGDSVIYRNSVFRIEDIIDYQAILEDGSIAFLADIVWKPSVIEAAKRLSPIFSYSLLPDNTIRYKSQFYGPIESLTHLESAIISIRMLN